MIRPIQTAFGQVATAAVLSVSLSRPTTVGNVLSLSLRFSPLTGTPAISDNFGNAFRPIATGVLAAGIATGFWITDIVRGGANHSITVGSQGGNQSLELSIAELSFLGRTRGDSHSEKDVLLAILGESHQQTALLQQLLARTY